MPDEDEDFSVFDEEEESPEFFDDDPEFNMTDTFAYPHDVLVRLRKTIFLCNNEWGVVEMFLDSFVFRFRRLGDPRVTEVHANKADIPLISPPLGYINWDHRSFFTIRAPDRQWRTGVPCEVVLFVNPVTREYIPINSYIGNTEWELGIRNMLVGKYPSFDEAIQRDHDTAFSRGYAIQHWEMKKVLYLLDEPIGVWDGSKMQLLGMHDNRVNRVRLTNLHVPLQES